MNEDEVTLVTSFLFDRSQEDCESWLEIEEPPT